MITAYIVAIVVLLIASAFFSSSETAYFSLSPLRSAKLDEAAIVRKLLGSRDRLLATLLSGNLIVNFAATSLWTTLLVLVSARLGLNEASLLSIGAAAMVVILLLVGEIIPKLTAIRIPMFFVKLYAPLLLFFTWIFFPLTRVLGWLSEILFRRRRKEHPFPTDEEVKTMIEMAVRYGMLRPQEERIMENLVDISERTVSEVMTPRVAMKALPLDTTRSEALSFAKKTLKSRYPVFDKTQDRIVGIVYTKDILTCPERTRIKKIIREPIFVPETKTLSSMLEELRRSDQHIAIVVDEFGGTAGLVTLEDILEAIFGEIVDEYDSSQPYIKISDRTYLVDGDIDIAALNHLFDDAFLEAEEDFSRLSELITDELGRIPKTGETVIYKGTRITVRKVRRQRIEKVVVELLPSYSSREPV